MHSGYNTDAIITEDSCMECPGGSASRVGAAFKTPARRRTKMDGLRKALGA
ncbi:MAG: hypothetical protein ABSA11_06820 [Candidatus Bathyarchaeia archaeon]